MSPRTLLIALATPLLLAACSRGPSDDDVNAAVKAQTAGLMGFSLKDVRKIGCEKSGDAWLCDVSMTLSMAGQEITQVQRLRIIKADKGWVISR